MSNIPVFPPLLLSASAFLVVSCATDAVASDQHVQSEMLYLRERAPLQTCWLSEPSARRYSLNSYVFYYYEQVDETPCPDGLPDNQVYYSFDRQIQPELAVHVVEDLRGWLSHDPDLSFLSEVPECRSASRSLGIGLISFPALTRASEIYVDFTIQCPGTIDGVRARIGFSYDEQVQVLTAESRPVIWR